MALRIGIVVGERSGDTLAAGLMQAILQRHPDAQFVGIAGPRMQALGCHSLFDYERLAVMGFIEPLKRLPELLSIRKSLIKHFLENPPDVFIGVDAPDFNLAIERKLKNAGIKSVHYVSPSVWAWRKYRVKKIARSVDLMLCLFPFEEAFYQEHKVPVAFVGHTMADEIPMVVDVFAARSELALPTNAKIIGLLPGSRGGEVSLLAAPFFETAKLCLQARQDLHFVVPLASEKTYQLVEDALAASGLDSSKVTLFHGQARSAMAAADVLLVASGTATLEALLLKKPMIMAYKLSPFTYFLAKRLVSLPYYSLANLLAGERLVDEFVQDAVVPDVMSAKLLALLENDNEAVQYEYAKVHDNLRQDASKRAADVVLKLCSNRG